MSKEIKNTISKLLSESSSYNFNDVLVNSLPDNKKLFGLEGVLEFSMDDFPSNILNDARKTKKESGVNSLCIANGIIELTVNSKTSCSPLFLTPVEYSIDKVRGKINLIGLEDETFVNPFVVQHLLNAYDIQLKDEFLTDFNTDRWGEFLNKNGLNQFEWNTSYVGNFHHHRYQILKELEELLEKSNYAIPLASLLGNSDIKDASQLKVFKGNLFPADTDHEEVFGRVAEKNIVIQGPPGTGKSQVLSNVVGKMMHEGLSALVLSEKRAALEVIQKRLAIHGLDKLCFIASADAVSKSFLTDLKKTWDYFENYTSSHVQNLYLSEQQEDNLQLTLDLLAQSELIGGVSFQEFQSLTENIELTSKYSSNIPSIPTYLNNESTIQDIYDRKLNNSIGHTKLNFLLSDDFHFSDKKITKWIANLEKLSSIFEIKKWGDLRDKMQLAADFQIFENDLFKNYSNILKPDSRAQKRFLSLRKKMKKLELERADENAVKSHWKTVPSEIEILTLSKRLENDSWLKRIGLKKRWNQLSNLNYSDAPLAIADYQSEIGKKAALSQINIDFCDLGVENPKDEVELIYQSIHHYTSERWLMYDGYDKEKRSQITAQHQAINDIWHDLKNHFNFDDNTDISSFLSAFEKELSELILLRKNVATFDSSLIQLIKHNSTPDELINTLYTGHWIIFKERFPNFAEFKISEIKSKVEQIITSQAAEGKLLAREIEEISHARYKHYHSILTTPAHKLSPKEKDLKKRLRRGKSLLVKEFAKTRSHPSIRELYNSDAKEWIQILKPIWLSNPTQLAKCFPLETNLFDLCIFDEASQIPLQNSLGALQRSKRVIVAGDEHQMGPTSYFKAGSSNCVDLLHQANYYWQSVSLSHHYRSSHPDLIHFSNKHFYNNELIAYPSYPSIKPIEYNFVENGVFIDRKNLKEAKIAAEKITLAMDTYKDIGVVAFSEEQLACIWSFLSPQNQTILERNSNNLGFFKSIENVQGDECEHLIISFGYAKNEAGEFHMRFGPMNTENGRNRLNVLLTRAQRSITFLSSIKSTDFKTSDNESVNLLKYWIQFVESYQSDSNVLLPAKLKATLSGNKLTFQYDNKSKLIARELVTTHSVMANRGWEINYS